MTFIIKRITLIPLLRINCRVQAFAGSAGRVDSKDANATIQKWDHGDFS